MYIHGFKSDKKKSKTAGMALFLKCQAQLFGPDLGTEPVSAVGLLVVFEWGEFAVLDEAQRHMNQSKVLHVAFCHS